MTDLTSQWKKGELPEGYYYVKDGENMIAEYLDGYFYNNGEPMSSFSGGVDEVLAPVPSFEEWKGKLRALDAAHKTIKMEDETINRLVCSGKQCNYKNAQLKELLKEVYIAINEGSYFDQCDILKKIDEVLK